MLTRHENKDSVIVPPFLGAKLPMERHTHGTNFRGLGHRQNKAVIRLGFMYLAKTILNSHCTLQEVSVCLNGFLSWQ